MIKFRTLFNFEKLSLAILCEGAIRSPLGGSQGTLIKAVGSKILTAFFFLIGADYNQTLTLGYCGQSRRDKNLNRPFTPTAIKMSIDKQALTGIGA